MASNNHGIAKTLMIVLSLMIVFASSARVFAQERTASDEAGSLPKVARVIMIASEEQREIIDPLISAIEGQLSDLQVVFEVEWVVGLSRELPTGIRQAGKISNKHDASLVFWCDLSSSKEVYLYLSDAGQRRILVRRLDSSEGEVQYESLAIIVHSVMNAMLSGGKIGIDAKPPNSRPDHLPSAPSTPLKEDQDPLRFKVELAYGMRAFGAEHPVLLGFNLRLNVLFTRWIHGFIGYDFLSAAKIEAEGLAIEVRSNPITIGAGASATWGRLHLIFSVAVIGDVVIQETLKIPAADVSPEGNTNFVFAVSPLLTVAFDLSRHIALGLTMGGRFDIVATRYASSNGEDTEQVFAPWRATPTGQLGIIFGF